MPRPVFPLAILLASLLLTAHSVRGEEAAPGGRRLEASSGPPRAESVERTADIGLRAPEGFEVALYADDDLAPNIFAMTIDSLGRVVVSGPGYVRILIDENGDGRADSFQQFADGPATGAQGLDFHGRDLFCIGDEGLLRYRDRNGDDRADGPPDVFLKVKAGGEHDAHALRRGPDGWWYLIAGNFAEIDERYVTLPASPVRKPQAGVLMRLAPDLSAAEVVADGYRNSYDFDFHPQGGVFVFDSDGERDVSLPWYRPTRLFQALPGSHAGWITRSWKRPDDALDMPPVPASFGRGSPTGVVCYRHRQFPPEYQDALFLLDWTFGRVYAVRLTRDGSTWTGDSVPFLTGVGQFGFAPTDVAVGPDGSLYVSIGGRGTRGGVFRVTYLGEGKSAAGADENGAADNRDDLDACLEAPQPLSSWSRARWMPLAQKLGRTPFLEAAQDDGRPVAARLRAIEILTELFDGLDRSASEALARAAAPEVRARAAWSLGRAPLGRTPAGGPPSRRGVDVLLPYLTDGDPLVVRCALEALGELQKGEDLAPFVPALAAALASDDRFVRLAAAFVASRLDQATYDRLAPLVRRAGTQALLSAAFAAVLEGDAVDANALEIGMRVLEGAHPPGLKLEAARLMQLALGDLGSGGRLPPTFDGYSARVDLAPHERLLDPLRVRLAKAFPTGDPRLDLEVSRLVAMVAPFNPALLDRVLSRIDAESDPVGDVHYLIVAASIPVERTPAQRTALAGALVALERKLVARGLNQDLHWSDRVAETYGRLVELDPGLPHAVVGHPEFGRPGHVVYLAHVAAEEESRGAAGSAAPQGPPASELLQRAVDAFAAAVRHDEDYPWTTDVVFLLGESADPRHRELVRRQYDRLSVRNAVLMVLAEAPEPADRPKFVEGLEASQLEVLEACLAALDQLSSEADRTGLEPSTRAAEQFALLRTLRRLGPDPREYALRDKVVSLLRRNTGQNFGFVLGAEGRRPQREAVARWSAWIESQYPEEAARQQGGEDADLARVMAELAEVEWEAGDVSRGRALFEQRSCTQCHGSSRALGPDLAGIAKRFSREDLFTAIAAPNRDVSPRYQTTLIQTADGKVYTGLIVYEAVDGLLLRNATNQTFRIEAADIEERRTLNSSLMPAGLLRDLSRQDLADLYAYLGTL